MDQLVAILSPLLSAYAGDYGWAIQVVSVIGTFRIFFKPIFAAIESAVKESPSTNDDLVLEDVKKNSFYKAFVFVIDLIGSIKIQKKN